MTQSKRKDNRGHRYSKYNNEPMEVYSCRVPRSLCLSLRKLPAAVQRGILVNAIAGRKRVVPVRLSELDKGGKRFI